MSSILERVRAVCRSERFIAEAAESDRLNRQSAYNMTALKGTGLAREFLPPEYGGGDISSLGFTEVMEEIAAADGSAATIWNMNCSSLGLLALMPPFPRLAAVLADARETGAMVCGGISAPSGELDARKGGFIFKEAGDIYSVSGRGGFATGSETASYFNVLGGLAPAAPGAPIDSIVFAIADLTDKGVEICRNWDAMGQRATGSHDIKLEGWRVPKADCVVLPLSALADMQKMLPQEIAHRRLKAFTGIMGCHIGASQRAFDLIVRHLEKRRGHVAIPTGGSAPPSAHSAASWARARLGRLDAALTSARSAAHSFAAELDAKGDLGQETQVGLIRALIICKETMEAFTTGITALTGAHGYVASSPLNLALRDLIGFNAMVWRLDDLYETLGKAAFGEPVALSGLGGT